MKKIVFAGGCFWGVQGYFKQIHGVLKTLVGYVNGRGQNPSYEEVCQGSAGFAEAVAISYDEGEISLEDLVRHLFRVIDPTSLNRQGNDRGVQYRSGIYYPSKEDKDLILPVVEELAKKYSKPLALEVKPLENFYPAEDYHQDYLDKHPGGYCHVDLSLAQKPLKDAEEIKKRIGPMAYEVLQENATEPPFSHPYYKKQGPGIFVDKLSGKVLFLSKDQYEPGCGWPSFTKPASPEAVDYQRDTSHGMVRKEVRSSSSKGHLGHVFTDGPQEAGGLRYCINGAALDFITFDEMKEKGYGAYMDKVKELGKDS